MSISTPLRVLAVVIGLVAPLSLGLATDAGSAAPAVTHQKVPVQRYISAGVNKKYVKKGKKVTISGVVEAPDTPACYAGVVLNVERSTHGAVYKVIGTVTTDAAGAYTVKATVKKKSRFRISVPATDACTSAQSDPRTVNVT